MYQNHHRRLLEDFFFFFTTKIYSSGQRRPAQKCQISICRQALNIAGSSQVKAGVIPRSLVGRNFAQHGRFTRHVGQFPNASLILSKLASPTKRWWLCTHMINKYLHMDFILWQSALLEYILAQSSNFKSKASKR